MRTELAPSIEAAGLNYWVLQVYLLGVQVPLQQLQLFNIKSQYGNVKTNTEAPRCRVALVLYLMHCRAYPDSA